MKGLELSEKFYNEYGKKMLETEFNEYLDSIAAGLVGHGSECFGFDDDISRDHDFDAGFCIWISEKDDAKFGFKLLRAYSRLVKEHCEVDLKAKSRFGSDFKGVKTIEDFYSFYVGSKLPETNREWLTIPDHYLAEVTNGKVFFDGAGEFTRIRNYLKDGRPEDVRLKKLASSLFYMAQSGQYNYERAALHGENVASAIALTEFVKSSVSAVFLLNGAYAPYYKWAYRAINGLKELKAVAPYLYELLRSPYDIAANKVGIEAVCALIKDHLVSFGYVGDKGDYLEPYAYSVNDLIFDADMRNSPVML